MQCWRMEVCLCEHIRTYAITPAYNFTTSPQLVHHYFLSRSGTFWGPCVNYVFIWVSSSAVEQLEFTDSSIHGGNFSPSDFTDESKGVVVENDASKEHKKNLNQLQQQLLSMGKRWFCFWTYSLERKLSYLRIDKILNWFQLFSRHYKQSPTRDRWLTLHDHSPVVG